MIRHLFCLIYILVHPKCRWGAGAFQCWERIKCFRSRCHQYEGGANVCSSCQRKSQPRLKCRHNPGFNPIPKLSVALTEVHRVQSTGKTFPALSLWSEAAPAGVSTLLAVQSNLDTGAIAGGCTGYSAEPLSKQRIGARHCTAAPEPIIQASTSQPQLRVIVLVCLQRGCSVVGSSLKTTNCLFNLIRNLRTVDDTSEQACLWLYSRLSSSSSSSTVMTKV